MMFWRKGWDSNPRYPCGHAGFQDRCLKPLGHPSSSAASSTYRRRDQEQPRAQVGHFQDQVSRLTSDEMAEGTQLFRKSLAGIQVGNVALLQGPLQPPEH